MLQKQIDEERKRLDALEKKLQELRSSDTPPPPVQSEISEEVAKVIVNREETSSIRQLMAAEGRYDPYLDEKFKKSIPLVGSPWRFSFGGYAKLDIIHDFSGTGNKRQLVLGQIPVDDNPSEGSYSHVQVSETRFHMETRNSDSPHENSVFIEFDFFDENSPNSVRLRHAYVRYGKLLVGQTWTLLSELRQLPLILDFASGDSILGGRTEQIRWTNHSEDKTFGWALALENFNDASIYNPDDLSGKDRSDFPRLSSGFTKLWDRVEWSTGASITQLRFDGSEGVGDSEELAYTATTAGRVYLDKNKNNWFGFGFGYQSGSINDVITFANAGIPNAAIDSEGDLDLAKAWNTQLGLHWAWNQSLSSNFSYAYAKITDVPEAFDPDWIKVGAAVHANLIYKYDEQLSLGIEVMHGERENVNGRDGDAQRIQFSTFYYY
ncbi:DcaP family trimeric outer membrane transporter [Pseudomaricurvus hydrocarbonicus]